MEEMSKHGKLGVAAMRAAMAGKTARKYVEEGKLPSELQRARDWRTRADPFVEDWPEIVARLKDAPELEAKTLFEYLVTVQPDRYEEGQLRTLQRRVRQWRAQEGPPKEVFFGQQHRPGEAMQTDFTWCTELGITIGGDPFPHLLCHPVLPYSNWEWATVCRSESLAAIRRGVQAALFRLGRAPAWHQTDNSTSATHDLGAAKRAFNEDYLSLVRHYGMQARTIAIGESNQNGDAEALHNVLKKRLEQHLLMRGGRDFSAVEEYERWVQSTLEKANQLRRRRIAEEIAVMRPLPTMRLVEYSEEKVGVSQESTVRVKHNTYSVPSRLIGEELRVRIYDDRLEMYYASQTEPELVCERLLGRGGHRINYRHIIWSLVRKPGAFARYRYREELFPTVTFRRAYDALAKTQAQALAADLGYLRILHLAAATMESDVEAALELLLEAGSVPTIEQVKALVAPERPEVPAMPVLEVDLACYDALLELGPEVAS